MTFAPAAIDLACRMPTKLKLRLRHAIAGLTGRHIRYAGNYRAWGEAAAAASGYAAPDILERVATAAAQVARGEAAYERDSVVFTERQYRWPLLSALLRAAFDNDRKSLAVLDFGGSLGSTYQQCRPFFPSALDVHWFVVEQEHFVRRGNDEFETDRLHFCHSAAEACARARPDIVLLSSVLQYIERPHDLLPEFATTDARYLFIDRTPLSNADLDFFTIQHVPTAIYKASYACRIFSRLRLVEQLERDWEIVAEFPSDDGWAIASGTCFRYSGMLLRCRR